MIELPPLRHERVSIAFYQLRAGEGGALLCLHALGGSAADWAGAAEAWRGPVYAVDFSGHGRSGRVAGGAYSAELLVGDADAALARLGEATLAGAGIGAYVALLLAGARPDHVPGALLAPGAGLSGGGALPDAQRELDAELGAPRDPRERAPSDPWLAQLEKDIRPVDYAALFAARARRLLLLEDGSDRPPWWEAVAGAGASERTRAASLRLALEQL
jgi:pimeloyl-ACP methyl ester carboxylesterase